MKKRIKELCLLVMVLAMLSGCAASSGGSGTLKVGVRSDIMGFGYLNPATEEYYGLEIDLARKLAEDLGYADVEFVTVTPDDRKDMLLSGNVDCLIATYSIEESRLKNFDFSPSYFSDNTSIMVEKSSMIESIDDLVGKKTGVLEGANTAPKLSSMMLELGLITETDFKGSSLEYRGTYQDLSVALEEGAVDAVCMDGGVARAYMEEDRRILDDVVGTENYGVATLKDSALSGPVAGSIQKMLDDGTIAALIDKWD